MTKLVAITFTFLTITFLTSRCEATFAQWPVADGGNGHFYEVVPFPSGLTWDQAYHMAESAGGYLATITSQAENDFIFELINDEQYWNGVRGPWIGGYQLPGSADPDADWCWVTGEPFVYTNWSPGQPNDAWGDETRLHIGWGELTIDSTWNDQPPDFSGIHSFVIEYIPEPTTIVLLTLGTLLLRKKR